MVSIRGIACAHCWQALNGRLVKHSGKAWKTEAVSLKWCVTHLLYTRYSHVVLTVGRGRRETTRNILAANGRMGCVGEALVAELVCPVIHSSRPSGTNSLSRPCGRTYVLGDVQP